MRAGCGGALRRQHDACSWFAIAADVVGNQLVPQAGGFVALSYAHTAARAASARSVAAPPVRTASGRITVVDYWATWCKPCTRIHELLEAAAPRWPDVAILRVDATAWPDPSAPALPEGATGLPVIEVLDDTGRRTHLLVGPDALRVVEIVDTLRKGIAP
jgi:thiol-disulfide isomerase/thioredoxin